MKHTVNTIQLAGPQLDYAVAMAEGLHTQSVVFGNGNTSPMIVPTKHAKVCELQKANYLVDMRSGMPYNPSVNWNLAGPIIEREHIDLAHGLRGINQWQAESSDGEFEALGESCLVAAMRLYVLTKFGRTITLP